VCHTRNSSDIPHASTAKRGPNVPRACHKLSANCQGEGGKKKRRAKGTTKQPRRGRKLCMLTFRRRNCAASSIHFGGKCDSLLQSAFFGELATATSSPSSRGCSASARICSRNRSSIERSSLRVGVVVAAAAAAAVEAVTASKRPAGKVSGLIGSSQSTLNCGTKKSVSREPQFFFSLINEGKEGRKR
jgi:hypothetical protein